MSETIEITKLIYGGNGLGFLAGKAVFVPFVLPGETVEVEIIKQKKNHAFARLIKVIEASPNRIKPECPNFQTCGGCDYLHMDYPSEIIGKQEILKENLQRLAGMKPDDIPLIDTISNERFYYRSHATLKINEKNQAGFFKKMSKTVTPFPKEGCRLLCHELNSGLNNQFSGMSELRATCGTDNQVYFSNKKGAFIREIIGPLTYDRDIRCFFQANQYLRLAMLECVKKYADLQEKETFLDFACGVGFFSLYLAEHCSQGIGIESSPLSIHWAVKNARFNNLKNIQFIKANTIDNKKLPDANVVIADPPRAGLSPETINGIVQLNPRTIVYVSCDPSTFSRDLKIFQNKGYKLEKLSLIDMFPGTSHIEIISRLDR